MRTEYNKNAAQLWHIDGTIEEITPKNGESITLKEMQKAVDGLVEMLWISETEFLLMNERGRLRWMLPNIQATLTAGMLVVGPVVYIPRIELFP